MIILRQKNNSIIEHKLTESVIDKFNDGLKTLEKNYKQKPINYNTYKKISK